MKDILFIFFRRKRIAVLFAILMIVFPMGFSYLLSEKYESSASVLLTPGRFKKPFLPNELDSRTGFVQVSMEDVASEVELMMSRPVLEKVVKANDLDVFGKPNKEDVIPYFIHSLQENLSKFLVSVGLKYPMSDFELAVVKLGGKVEAEFLKRTNIITIKYQTRTPELAQAVVNSIVGEYIKHHIEVHGYAQAVQVTAIELENNEEQVKNIEAAINTIKAKYGVYDVQKERESALEDYLQAKSNLESLKEIDSNSVLSSSRGFYSDDPIFVGLLNELTQAELKRIESLSVYGKNDKRITTINKQISSLRSKIKREHAKNISSWGEASKRFSDKLSVLEKAQVEIVSLERELEGALAAYEISRQKYNESLISQAMDDARVASVQIVSSASYSATPASPKRFLFLMISIFLATTGSVAASFAAEKLYSRIVNVEQIQKLTDVNVLFSLPEFTRKQLKKSAGFSPVMFKKMATLNPFFSSENDEPKAHLLISPNPHCGTSFLVDQIVSYANVSLQKKTIGVRVSFAKADAEYTHLNDILKGASADSFKNYIKEGKNKGSYILNVYIPNDEITQNIAHFKLLIKYLHKLNCENVLIDLPNEKDDNRYLNFVSLCQHVYVNVGYDVTNTFAFKKMLSSLETQMVTKPDGIFFSRQKFPIPQFIYNTL